MAESIQEFEYIVLGADRSGLQMASLLQQSDRNVLVLEPGALFECEEALDIRFGTKIFYIDKSKKTNYFELIDEQGSSYKTNVLLVSHPQDDRSRPMEDHVFANACRPARTENGLPIITAELESCNVSHLYFLGSHTGMRAYGDLDSIHDQNYQAMVLHRILEQKYHGVDICRHLVPHDADTVKNLVHNRMNLASTGWRRPSYIGDFLVVEDGGKMARFYSQLTPDYFREHIARPDMVYYTLTFEEGINDGPGTVVSKCQGWEIISECHLSGDPIQGNAYWNSKVDEIVAASIV